MICSYLISKLLLVPEWTPKNDKSTSEDRILKDIFVCVLKFICHQRLCFAFIFIAVVVFVGEVASAEAPAVDSRAVSMYNLGLNAVKQGSTESAIIFLKRGCEISPHFWQAQFLLGTLFSQEKRYNQAALRFQEVLKSNPGHSESNYELGLCFMELGNNEDAIKHLMSVPSESKSFKNAQKILTQITGKQGPFSIVSTDEKKIETSREAKTDLPVRPVKDKWALVIGISKFANDKYNLKYAAKDAEDFSSFLINEAGFKRDHVRILLNQNATRRNIVSSIGSRWLPNVTDPDDLVVLYVSTHGTPAHKDRAGRNYIVAYDTEAEDPYATGVNMDELYIAIKERVKSDRALIVMDTCYSGGAVPGSRGLNEGDNFDVSKITLGRGQLVISSSGVGQRSWESRDYANGVFTKALMNAIRSNQMRINQNEVFKKLRDDVSWEVKRDFGVEQTPQVGGVWEGNDLILSVPASAPRSAGSGAVEGLMVPNVTPLK